MNEVKESKYLPHQQRVLDEKSDLDEKLVRLELFIKGSPIFNGLSEHGQDQLKRQRVAMTEYSDILAERIADF